jgi:hypothetical protein
MAAGESGEVLETHDSLLAWRRGVGPRIALEIQEGARVD